MFVKARNNISQMQMIALGFFCIVLSGTLLLMTQQVGAVHPLIFSLHCLHPQVPPV